MGLYVWRSSSIVLFPALRQYSVAAAAASSEHYLADLGHPTQEFKWAPSLSSSSFFKFSRANGGQSTQTTLCKEQLGAAIDALSHLPRPPSADTFFFLLKSCIKHKSLLHAKQVYLYLTHNCIPLTGFLGDYLVVAFAKCGGPAEAWQISHRLPCRTVFSWSALISAHADHGHYNEAFHLYQLMQEEKVEPNKYTLVSLFKACAQIHDLSQGKRLHVDARKRGLASDLFIGSSLVNMYGKCGAIAEAEDVFNQLLDHDIVSWTSMLSAYVDQGQGEKALLLYRQMQKENLGRRELTSVIALQACGILAEKEEAQDVQGRPIKPNSFELGQALHSDAHRKGHAASLMVGNTLVRVYGKCKTIPDAQNAFGMMSIHDVVSWNALLSAYIEQNQGRNALQLFRGMHEESIEPDELTFVLALQACSILAEKEELIGQLSKMIALEIARALKMDAQKKNVAMAMLVGTTLLGVYGKCGEIEEAEKVFDTLLQRNIVSWTAMLFAYIEHGQAEKAFLLYRKMQEEQVVVDAVTFVSILQLCGDIGSLELCRNLHFGVICSGYDQIPTMQTTLVYTYGNCASMENARVVFDGLLFADTVSWSASVAGHAGEGSPTRSLYLFEEFKLGGRKPDDILLTSVLSACSYGGLTEEALKYFDCVNRDTELSPNLKHYGTVIDLLGRAGNLKRVQNLLTLLPMQADLAVWLSLLGACRSHGHVELGRRAFDRAVELKPKAAAAYVLMANLYADAGLQHFAAEVEEEFKLKQGACWAEAWQEMEE